MPPRALSQVVPDRTRSYGPKISSASAARYHHHRPPGRTLPGRRYEHQAGPVGKPIGVLARLLSMDHEPADFAEFYRSSRDGCFRAVVASVGSTAVAEDIVAEAFARAWASWPKVRSHPAPHAWVLRTALNMRVSWWRRRWREVELPPGHVPGGDGEAAVAGAVITEVLAAVLRLPLRQRQVIGLRIFLDLDTAQTAEVLSIAPGTVKAHLARAIAALRHELVPQEES